MKWSLKRKYSLSEINSFFEQARRGDEESKEKIYAFLRSRLLVLSRYRVPEKAEDIVQEALLIVHNHFSEFDSIEGLLAFTNQVLRNKIGNIYQSRDRWKSIDLEDIELAYSISGEMETGEIVRIVREAIDRLGGSRPACCEILLCLYHGLDPDEISTKLGIAKSKLKVRTFRCRNALRDLLLQQYNLRV